MAADPSLTAPPPHTGESPPARSDFAMRPEPPARPETAVHPVPSMRSDPSMRPETSTGPDTLTPRETAMRPAPAMRPDPSAGPEPASVISYAELLVQDLPEFPSLEALRALTDQELPSTDDIPMPEPMVQGWPLRYTVSALAWWYRRHRPGTCVAGDLLVYTEGRPKADGRVRAESRAPDVLVAFDVGERDRDSYVVWREGKAPDFVLEIVTKSTWHQDVGQKMDWYGELGVGEYFLYDPTGGWLEPRLQGHVLEAGRYRRLDEGRLGNGERGVCSAVLGLCAWLRDGELRWSDPETGWEFEDYDEAQAGREAAESRVQDAEDRVQDAESRVHVAESRADREATARTAAEDRAQVAEDRADREAAARIAAEQEVARLRAQLQRPQSNSGAR